MATGREQDKISAPTRARARGCAGIFFCIMVVISAMWGAGLGAFVWLLEDSKSTIAAMDTFRPKIGSKVYSSDGVLLGEFNRSEVRSLVSLKGMPIHLQKAFIATEDHPFYEHKGVRPLAVVSALKDSLRTGRRLRGGSTITQQLVRNVETTRIGQERTVVRKLREALAALALEREFTKDEILELYLNQIFLGVSAYGVEAAAQQYFGKPCQDLTLGESAVLAGLTRAPNPNQPLGHPDRALTRRDIVLQQMYTNGFVSKEEYDAAVAEDLMEALVTPEERLARAEAGREAWSPKAFKAPYFVEDIRQTIRDGGWVNEDVLFEQGLEIHTTLDWHLQEAAEEALVAALDAFDEKKREYLEARDRLDEFVPVSGALVCLDNRRGQEGKIRAMVGGRDFSESKFNMARQALRQPGSSVKPFVWAAALDSGMTPSDLVMDAPIVRIDAMKNVWKPQNFTGEFTNQPMTLRRALEKSVNSVAIRLVERTGMPLVRSYLQSAGITSPISDHVNLTIALGTPEMTVIDVAVAYSSFAGNGVRCKEPTYVDTIRDRDGFLLHEGRVDLVQAMREDIAYAMTYLLQGVCEPYNTGWRTRELDRPRAGKTGTSNESRNVWFSGFTPYYTCIVWLGYEDNRPLGKGRDYTGGRLACPVWTTFMVKAHEGLPPTDFTVPGGVKFHNVDRETGLAGGKHPEVFIRNTRPPIERPLFVQLETFDDFYAAEGLGEF
jgi:1A family penicillin-binding protein